jgi:hypothetical protein
LPCNQLSIVLTLIPPFRAKVVRGHRASAPRKVFTHSRKSSARSAGKASVSVLTVSVRLIILLQRFQFLPVVSPSHFQSGLHSTGTSTSVEGLDLWQHRQAFCSLPHTQCWQRTRLCRGGWWMRSSIWLSSFCIVGRAVRMAASSATSSACSRPGINSRQVQSSAMGIAVIEP